MRLIHRLIIAAIFTLLTVAYVVLLPASGVIRTTLNNGLRVVIVKNSIAPVVSVQLNYLVGSAESPQGFPGTAHAVEHMMYRGSPGLSGDQIEVIMAGLGGEYNAFTEPAMTQYVAKVPAVDLKIVLQMEAIRMRGLICSEKDWELERGAINQEIAKDIDDGHEVLDDYYRKLFKGTPYDHDALGSVDSFKRTPARMLERFHADWYAPNNALLVICGDVDPQETLRTIRKLFGDIPAKPLPQRTKGTLQPLNAEEREYYATADKFDGVVVAYRMPGYGDKDFAAGKVLAYVLNEEKGRIAKLSDDGEVISSSFEKVDRPMVSAAFLTASVPIGTPLQPKADQLKKIIAEYQQGGVPVDRVETVKKSLKRVYLGNSNSTDVQAESWSEAIGLEGCQSLEERLDNISRVTAADVTRVARKWLRNESALTVYSHAEQGGVGAVKKTFNRGSESFKPKRYKTDATVPSWANGIYKLPPVVFKMSPKSDILLNNGLRLIVLQSRDIKLPRLSGNINSTPELQVPAGKEGVDSIMEEMLSRPMSEKKSYTQILDSLGRLGARMGVGVSFSITAAQEDFVSAVKLLAETMLHPVWSAKEFDVAKTRLVHLTEAEAKDVDSIFDRTYYKGIYPSNDPEQRHATPRTTRQISLQDVKQYHAQVFRPDMTTIVVASAMSPATVQKIVEECFGGWKAQGPKPETKLPPTPANNPVNLYVSNPDGNHARVLLAHTSTLNRSRPVDYYPFLLGLDVLAGSSAARLYRHIRTKEGLVYDIRANLEMVPTRSMFNIYYETDAKNVSKVRHLIEHEILDMQSRPISPFELQQAKCLATRKLALMASSVSGVTDTLLYLANESLPLDMPLRAVPLLQKVTAEELQAAFKKWIRLDGLCQVSAGPGI